MRVIAAVYTDVCILNIFSAKSEGLIGARHEIVLRGIGKPKESVLWCITPGIVSIRLGNGTLQSMTSKGLLNVSYCIFSDQPYNKKLQLQLYPDGCCIAETKF